jgi:hypothetical protein
LNRFARLPAAALVVSAIKVSSLQKFALNCFCLLLFELKMNADRPEPGELTPARCLPVKGPFLWHVLTALGVSDRQFPLTICVCT